MDATNRNMDFLGDATPQEDSSSGEEDAAQKEEETTEMLRSAAQKLCTTELVSGLPNISGWVT